MAIKTPIIVHIAMFLKPHRVTTFHYVLRVFGLIFSASVVNHSIIPSCHALAVVQKSLRDGNKNPVYHIQLGHLAQFSQLSKPLQFTGKILNPFRDNVVISSSMKPARNATSANTKIRLVANGYEARTYCTLSCNSFFC